MERLLTTGAAARKLGINAATLTRWVASGLVEPADRTAGGHFRWDLGALRRQVRGLRGGPAGREEAEDIASVIHDANRRLQIIQGDPRPSPLWDEAPEYQVRESTESVVLAMAEAERTAEQNHQGWLERLVADGWTLGPKDEAAKTHPLLVPFAELPAEARQKDRLFIAIVRALEPDTASHR